MSVIQSIREKYAKWAVVAIALALLGFILTDYLSAKNRMFGGSNSTTIGSVNGKKIDYTGFESKLRSMDDQASQQGRSLSETDRHTNMERLWNQEVEEIILNSQFDKLGLVIGKKELNDWFFGTNPPADLKQRFTDQSGMYNPSQVQETINQIKRSGTQIEKDQLNLYLASLEYSRMLEKFNSLFSNSVYYPKWYVEKQNAENSALAKIAYVSYPYAKIADSTIKVSNKEIEEYISKNKDQFKQEESRSIAVVVFDAAPTAADSAAIKKQVTDMKADFAAAPDPAVFLARYGSTLEYYDGYTGKSQIQIPEKDSVIALAKNQVYGAYHDASTYVIAKMIDSKPMPDSVKVRHILVKTFDPQQGQQLLPDSVGKNRIDSIERAIKGGARFDSLAVKYSDDKGSGAIGGLLEVPLFENGPTSPYFAQGKMVKEFNDYSFEGKKGEMKVVKTIFGYHLIEILDQKNFQPHYKIAYFGKRIVATDETDAAALEAASKFASESRDLKSFEANYEKIKAKGYQKFIAANIKPTDISISSLSAYGTSRQLVRDVYKADRGDVLPQQRIGDKYVVAVLTDVFEEGTMSAATARGIAEPVLNKKKKAEQVKQMLGNFSTLDAAAVILKDSVKVIDSLRISGGASLGYEPKVLGAAFNTASKGKLINEPLAGLQAVYVVRVDDQTTTSVSVFGIEEQKAQLRQRAQQMQNFYSNPVTLLRKLAKIKDNRSNFY